MISDAQKLEILIRAMREIACGCVDQQPPKEKAQAVLNFLSQNES